MWSAGNPGRPGAAFAQHWEKKTSNVIPDALRRFARRRARALIRQAIRRSDATRDSSPDAPIYSLSE
jgi:hypothetical protein